MATCLTWFLFMVVKPELCFEDTHVSDHRIEEMPERTANKLFDAFFCSQSTQLDKMFWFGNESTSFVNPNDLDPYLIRLLKK